MPFCSFILTGRRTKISNIFLIFRKVKTLQRQQRCTVWRRYGEWINVSKKCFVLKVILTKSTGDASKIYEYSEVYMGEWMNMCIKLCFTRKKKRYTDIFFLLKHYLIHRNALKKCMDSFFLWSDFGKY